MPSSGMLHRVSRKKRCLGGIANVCSSLILVILTMEAILSSETSALTRVTRCNIAEDGILHTVMGKT
jgi:hypothetical protein